MPGHSPCIANFADYNGFRGACEYALTITENRRGGTENRRVFIWVLCGPLRFLRECFSDSGLP
ncbi:MAG: hypothetical protein DRI57_06270 [Deltaproteobacteria bacterium]|nr:MAG: hypothetical protein DRI57_06270 [Deltaproteobacteria bacterium]